MAELVELSEDESWELAAGQTFCRVAWTTASGPMLIPLNHVTHERTIWFRTSAYSTLVREVDDERVAVLVDDVHPETRHGWSVQLRGVAHIHWHAEEVPDAVHELHAWASGARPLWVEVRADEVHGRRLLSGD